MKKIIALLTAVIVVALVCCSCDGKTPGETTTTPEVTTTAPSVIKDIKIENGVLLSCVGQADENGVYTVPEGITFIGEGCFSYDRTLKKIIIPSTVKTIGSGAFIGCTSLKEAVIEEGVEILGSHAFWGCNALENIVLPESITEVSDYAFAYCSLLASVKLGQNVKRIGYSAFSYCTALEGIIIPSAVKKIDGIAFLGCSSLENVDFSSATELEAIGIGAFGNCMSLRAIELPENLRDIGQEAFYGCNALVGVKIGSKVESVAANAFNYTPWYIENKEEYLIVGDGVLIKCNVMPKYMDLSGKGIKVIGGTAFINDRLANGTSESVYGYKYADQLTDLVIPEGVTKIQMAAFYYCMALENVSLPSTLETIESSAFELYAEENLSTITTKIDFSKCTNLKTIGASAFNGCGGIDDLVLPSSVEYIGSKAFSNTKAYDKFFESVETAKENVFKIVNNILVWTYVPNGSTGISVPDGVRMIAGGACAGWDNAVVPTTPEGLRLSWRSKYNISNAVTKIEIPESVEVIGDNAFYNLKAVKQMTIPGNVKSIGDSAFDFCSGLEKVTIEEGVEEINSGAFSSCTSLVSVSLPSTLEYIGSGAFASCQMLKSLAAPQKMTEIGTSVFDSMCTSLETVYLPEMFRPNIFGIMGDLSVNTKVMYYNEK